jgi:hypothetical protein
MGGVREPPADTNGLGGVSEPPAGTHGLVGVHEPPPWPPEEIFASMARRSSATVGTLASISPGVLIFCIMPALDGSRGRCEAALNAEAAAILACVSELFKLCCFVLSAAEQWLLHHDAALKVRLMLPSFPPGTDWVLCEAVILVAWGNPNGEAARPRPRCSGVAGAPSVPKDAVGGRILTSGQPCATGFLSGTGPSPRLQASLRGDAWRGVPLGELRCGVARGVQLPALGEC